MSGYIISEEVKGDLRDIWDYIALDKISAANRWIEKLIDAFETIAKSPAIGHTRKELTTLPILFWPVGAYLILYRVSKDAVEIVAVTQGSRDVPMLLAQRVP